MIKLYLNISDVIHQNEHTKHANCGSHENFLKLFVNAILLYDEKAYLRKLLPLPKAPRVSLVVDTYFIINT